MDDRDGSTPMLGERLRAAREAAGLSVAQVSSATRIRVVIVGDLEADRFDSSGGAVYARGHVRAIAHTVGIDDGPLVAAFDRQTGSSIPTVAAPQPGNSSIPTLVAPAPAMYAPGGRTGLPLIARPEPRGPRWHVAGLGVLAVLVVLLAAGTLRGPSPKSVPTVATPTAPPSPSPTATRTAKPAPKPVAKPAGAALVVSIRGGASWIGVSAAGRPLFDGTVQDGWQQSFTDPVQLRLRVGNAAAVQITCAGKPSGPVGTTGAVRTLVCGHDGLLPG